MASMMSTARTARASLFMQRCRQSRYQYSSIKSECRASSTVNSSQFDPSNFNKPLRNPNANYDANPGPPPLPEQAFIKASWHKSAARPVAVASASTSKITPLMRLKTLFGWKPPTPKIDPVPFNAVTNPYRARKKWPPEFSKLHPKQQFHYEKTYRRRAKLKWARPNWNRWVRLVQHTIIVFVVIYFVFILDPSHGQGTPFDGFRVWFFNKIKNFGQLPDEVRNEAEKLEKDARQHIEDRKS